MAAVITLHSVRLATNANGALLLTWLLDTCNFPNRFKMLAPRLVNHLAKLCTHKLASLTVLKLINQRQEPEAREAILNALFSTDDDNQILRRILEDQLHGAAVIYKILTSPFVADQSSTERRSQLVSVVRIILQKLKVMPNQGYKRLMDEVGLTDRNVATPPLNGHRGPQRSTTPREYGPPNTYAPGTYYSPQHNYVPQQQYIPSQQMDMLGRAQMDSGMMGMELQGSQSMYSPQVGSQHQHQESIPNTTYQFQQMMMVPQRPYNGYASNPQQPHQPMYQNAPTAQQSQFGGPLMAGQTMGHGMGLYNMNGTQGYGFSSGDMYARNQTRQR
jgi:protein JSN1